MDVHGAGAQRSDQKDGDFSSLTYVSDGYYYEPSPQGDATRSYNYVRLVRDADASSLGSLTVTLSPRGAIDAGAQWSIDNTTWYDSGYTLTGISPGTVTIYYSEVNGYTTPANGSATIVEGKTATATGTYTESSTTGTLTVTISPQGAIDAGAQWSVDDGTTWYDSGYKATLGVNTYTVTYKAINGYDVPADETVTVTDGGAASASGTYTESATTGTLTVTISPQGAIDAGAQWSVDGGTTWYNSATEVTLDAAVYTITYKMVNGYDTPAVETATVTDGGATSTTGIYAEQAGYTLNDAVILIQILTGKTDANSWEDADSDSVATLQDVILIIRDLAGF
jgi:hypothetical protein